MTTVDDLAPVLDEILRGFLVRCGRPDLRSKLAARLAREGLFAAELLAICKTVEERGKPAAQTAAILGSILDTEKSWRESIADIVFAREAREKRQAERIRDAAENAAFDITTRQHNAPTLLEIQAQRDAFRRYLAVRVLIDNVDPQRLADLEGIPLEMVSLSCEEFPSP